MDGLWGLRRWHLLLPAAIRALWLRIGFVPAQTFPETLSFWIFRFFRPFHTISLAFRSYSVVILALQFDFVAFRISLGFSSLESELEFGDFRFAFLCRRLFCRLAIVLAFVVLFLVTHFSKVKWRRENGQQGSWKMLGKRPLERLILYFIEDKLVSMKMKPG